MFWSFHSSFHSFMRFTSCSLSSSQDTCLLNNEFISFHLIPNIQNFCLESRLIWNTANICSLTFYTFFFISSRCIFSLSIATKFSIMLSPLEILIWTTNVTNQITILQYILRNWNFSQSLSIPLMLSSMLSLNLCVFKYASG